MGNDMSGIKIDPRKLLGFKIIATDASTIKLSSPKIGDKGCPVVEAAPVAATASEGELLKT